MAEDTEVINSSGDRPLASPDIRRVVQYLPKDVRYLIQKHALFVAGGFIRSVICGEKPSDIDLFGSSKEKLKETSLELALSRRGRMHETRNAFTVLSEGRTPVQFIHRWLYEDASKLLQEFDFTVARAVVWWDVLKGQWYSLCDKDYYSDLASKRLVYCAPIRVEDVGGSIMRARKFLAKGYFLSANDLGLLITRLVSGIDFYAVDRGINLEAAIIALLREVDPLIIMGGLDIVDEHGHVPTEFEPDPAGSEGEKEKDQNGLTEKLKAYVEMPPVKESE